MDLSQLQLKLEELDMESWQIDEVLTSMRSKRESAPPPAALKEEALAIMREYEPDWRKKAIIAAEIVKRGLSS